MAVKGVRRNPMPKVHWHAPVVSSSAVIASALLLVAQERVVRVEAQRDNTLIEDPTGSLSNGSGPAFFVGRTNQAQNSIRRGLLRFELEGVLPAGAVVASVHLLAHSSGTNGQSEIGVYRLVQDWGEGSSSGSGGMGAPAQPGDATWLHTFHAQEFWRVPGAMSRLARASALTTLKSTGSVVWNGPGLKRDVEAWLRAPEQNFGWVLIGDELAPQTVARFDSRESSDPSSRPVLEITYREGRARR